MSESGMIGYDTGFEVETAANSGVFFELGKVTNVTPPNESVDQVDVTHMKSPGRTREFIQGLIDPGEMTVSLNHIPGSDTDEFVIAWRKSGETRLCRIVYPNDVADRFPGFVLGYTPSMDVGDKMAADLSIKVAGEITREA